MPPFEAFGEEPPFAPRVLPVDLIHFTWRPNAAPQWPVSRNCAPAAHRADPRPAPPPMSPIPPFLPARHPLRPRPSSRMEPGRAGRGGGRSRAVLLDAVPAGALPQFSFATVSKFWAPGIVEGRPFHNLFGTLAALFTIHSAAWFPLFQIAFSTSPFSVPPSSQSALAAIRQPARIKDSAIILHLHDKKKLKLG